MQRSKRRVSRTINWQDIHQNLTPQLQQEWKQNFNHLKDEERIKARVRSWIKVGLSPNESHFAKWLENKNYLISERWRKNSQQQVFNPDNKEQLKDEYLNDWTDVHVNFDEIYQQQWQQLGFTKSETKEWLDIGFTFYDYDKVQQWKSHNFTPFEAQEWLVLGLKKGDHHFASWLRTKDYTPNFITNLPQLRTNFNNLSRINPQQWLETYHPDKSIKESNISLENLTGSLDLSAYQQLEKLDYSYNQLTHLNLSNNPNLTNLSCKSNQFPNFNFLSTLPNPQKITELHLSNNPINQTLDFLTPFVGLEELRLGNYLGNTNFHGSLSPLSNCQQLKTLNISNTNLNSDIELLPPNLETIRADNMPEIQEKMKGFEDRYGYNYQLWRNTNLHLIKENEFKISQITQKDSELTNLNQEIMQLSIDLADLEEDLDKKQTELTNANKITSNLQKDLKNKQQVLDNQTKELNNISQQNQDLKQKLEYSITDLEIMEVELISVKQDKEINEQKLQNKNNNIRELETQIKEKDSQLAIIQSLAEKLQKKSYDLQLKLNKTQQLSSQEKQDLEQEKQILETNLTESKQEARILQNKVNNLRLELIKAESDYETKLKELEEQKTLSQNTNLTESELSAIQERITQLEEELIQAKQELDDKKEQILSLKKQLNIIKRQKDIEIISISSERDNLQLDLDSVHGELKDKKRELISIQNRIRDQIFQNSTFTTKLRRQERELESEVKNLKDKEVITERQMIIINNIYKNVNQSIVGVEGDVQTKDFSPKEIEYQPQVEQFPK